ncbi:GGDEF domain-containing protein [Solibacillus sp. FSL K6-1523]|uniref:GGDEF domain-containing protein n=1 Tax=Solibacillus sp. FSL K6-1523 TaxID=2921471 RepID=UPI0030F5AC9E
MKSLWVKLLLSLLLFTVIIVSVITLVNRQLLIQDIKQQQHDGRTLIENHILSDMQAVDKAYLYLDYSYSESMEVELRSLQKYYESNPDIYSWDINEIKNRTGMDFFIIDEHNKVIIATYEPSVGLDFSECCVNFAALLDDRRNSGEYYSDGIDISAVTNELWRYSYLATKDRKYLLEMGSELKNSPIFESFNFLETVKNLVMKYDDLNNVEIIGDEGFLLGAKDDVKTIQQLSPELKIAYNESYENSEKVEVLIESKDGIVETHQFIPYLAKDQLGNSTKRIIYIEYNNYTELQLLKKNTQNFWIILVIAMGTAGLLLLIILKILNTTILSATYDPLTGVYNRSSYIQYMEQLILKKDNAHIGLLLIDLDNFKQVNDQHGHLKGDEVLKQLAAILKEVVSKKSSVVRFGGDEFAIVVEDANEQALHKLASEVITCVRKKQQEHSGWDLLTVSIGGTIQETPQEEEVSIFMRCDQALYESKNKGKDQYTFISTT